jgi:hypothetical protein
MENLFTYKITNPDASVGYGVVYVATSALDTAAELRIQKSFDELAKGRTPTASQ